ncbi:transcriptional family [Leptolyngbya sp. Heron Island J]|uniref:helix-turn-helix transcriptional regulator n=1 Tax=Leptolyngbya sp. Heron Island J TaxID=1385935 RepID=UPI0003B9ED4E|nr:AraC family transcriptional regulator [Leptolyngbya sp. Heron Island J]ESA33719.1 transcriptional family [Leptolyngbya sp. Heron Island J]
MVERLSLSRWDEWLDSGSWRDPRLLHADPSDRIYVCPTRLGDGYYQHIFLEEDTKLVILDYSVHQDLVFDVLGECDRIEFEFQLAGPQAGYSFFIPYFGFQEMGIKRARKRYFKVEVFFEPPLLSTYFQAVFERFTPKNKQVANNIMQSLYLACGGGPTITSTDLLQRIFAANKSYYRPTFEQLMPDQLYNEVFALGYATRSPITVAMQTIIGQILSCPYCGPDRRIYLKQKAMELVNLRLEVMTRPRLPLDELNHIYQAAAFLRENLTNPPTVETLARHIGTNRLKINQGFRQVYGTTPFGYLKDYRLMQAKQLLMTSELSVAQVATAVGYSSRSRFATAFRKEIGINPKTFQMQTWHYAS